MQLIVFSNTETYVLGNDRRNPRPLTARLAEWLPLGDDWEISCADEFPEIYQLNTHLIPQYKPEIEQLMYPSGRKNVITDSMATLQRVLYVFFSKYAKTSEYTIDSLRLMLESNGLSTPQHQTKYFDAETREGIFQPVGFLHLNQEDIDTIAFVQDKELVRIRIYEYNTREEYYTIISLEILLHGLYPSKCKHCGKWYFQEKSRRTNRLDYCKRKSPLKKYNHLECYNATHNAKQDAARKKKTIIKNAQASKSQEKSDTFTIKFYNECDQYTSHLKEAPTPQNFQIYFDFLESEKQSKAWL